jgi:hypothetical protein
MSKARAQNYYEAFRERDPSGALVRDTAGNGLRVTLSDADRQGNPESSGKSIAPNTRDDESNLLATWASSNESEVLAIDTDDTTDEVFMSGTVSGVSTFGKVQVRDVNDGSVLRTFDFRERIPWPLYDWFRYKPGADAPENRENIGNYPLKSDWLKFDDDSPYSLHVGNIRDWRAALTELCPFFKNAATGNAWIAPGPAAGGGPDQIYRAAVDDAVTAHSWRNSNTIADESGLRPLGGHVDLDFYEVHAIVKKLEESDLVEVS